MNNNIKVLGGFNANNDRHLEDFYATDMISTSALLDNVDFRLTDKIIEPCCGDGMISKRLLYSGFEVESFDLYDRGFGTQMNMFDFGTKDSTKANIITNPPYKDSVSYVQHAIDIVAKGYKVAMFLRLQFLESKERYQLFQDNKLKHLIISSDRSTCYKNGDYSQGSCLMPFAWFVFEKGYYGLTDVTWFRKADYMIPKPYRLVDSDHSSVADYVHCILIKLDSERFLELQYLWDNREIINHRIVDNKYAINAYRQTDNCNDVRTQLVVNTENFNDIKEYIDLRNMKSIIVDIR